MRWLFAPQRIQGLSERTVGRGADSALLLWSKGVRKPPRDAIVFLHGWGPPPPFVYGKWFRHLAMLGNAIVYPVYQQPGVSAPVALSHTIAGIRTGLRAVRANPDAVVAVGHGSGGALAFDYAAAARQRQLPAPRGLLAVYPDRQPRGGGGKIQAEDLSLIPAQTPVAVIAGPGDPIPHGAAQARALLREASRAGSARGRYLTAPKGAETYIETPAVRRHIWAPLDRLIDEARGG